jgi:hypothetical protein
MTVILFYNICIVIQVIQVIQSDSKWFKWCNCFKW